MRTVFAIIGWGAIGAISLFVGEVAGMVQLAVAAVEAQDGPKVEPPPAPRPPVCNRARPFRDQGDTVAADLQQVQSRIATLRADNAKRDGKPLDWPMGHDPVAEELAIEQTLEDLLGELDGGWLHSLDCGEYPCVAVVAFSSDHGDPSDQLDAVQQALPDRLDEGSYRSLPFVQFRSTRQKLPNGEVVTTREGHAGITIAMHPGALDLPAKRVGFRIQEATDMTQVHWQQSAP